MNKIVKPDANLTDIEEKINKKRQELHELMDNKDHFDEEACKLSQELDKLLNIYYNALKLKL